MAILFVMRNVAYSTSASAFSCPSLATLPVHSPTICYAKLNKLASGFDMDEILSNEKEFDNSSDGESSSITSSTSRGRRLNPNKDKKRKAKEQLKQERQQLKHRQKNQKHSDPTANDIIDLKDGFDDSADVDGHSDVEKLLQTIDFLAYEVPSSLNGKRIDAALVELLNEDNGSSDGQSLNHISISRSQCETLLSNKCIFVVPPEKATAFLSARQSHRREVVDIEEENLAVPLNLIEQHGSSIERKAHALESSSIIIYPSRASLLSTSSSSTLLSNFIPPTEIILQNIPLDILFEDEHMIVINKRAGMVVHPAAGNWDGTVVNALAYYLTNESTHGAGDFFTENGKEVAESDNSGNAFDAVTNSISTLRPGIVHRLDKGTTGVLVVAKTSSALQTLSEAFADRKVKKQYLAIAIGNPGDDQRIDKPIGRHPLHRQRMRVVPDASSSMPKGQTRLTGAKSTLLPKQGRQALSHIHTIAHNGKMSVVHVRIATGRTHQIRVHLQDHGTPIYGDDVYGLSDYNKALSQQRGISRPLLHAQRLEINHPVTGENMVFEAEVPDDMMGVVKSIWPAGEKIEL